jgi:hypothetical protein
VAHSTCVRRWIQVECSLVLGAVGASSELAARGDVVTDEMMGCATLCVQKRVASASWS